MGTIRLFILCLIITSVECTRPQHDVTAEIENISINPAQFASGGHMIKGGNGALLLTRFNSLEELKDVVQIQYYKDPATSPRAVRKKSYVLLTHRSDDREVICLLKTGVSEADFLRARDGHISDRVEVGLQSPYALINRNDLVSVEILGRRRYQLFGEGDIAFYDLAETQVHHIVEEDSRLMSAEDLSEKGYLNTFNHTTAQAFITSLFSETLADYIGDVHERNRMPELITGIFTEDQLADLKDGPVDNYIDMINNEWGQELGKQLNLKYNISRLTNWTPELLADYLNDIQRYHSWAFQIGFKPYRATDEIVIRFANKINKVLLDLSELEKFYN